MHSHVPIPLPLLLVALLAACRGEAPPSSLGGGGLAPCPPLPHCVSTHAAEPPDRRIAAVPFSDAPDAAARRAKRAIQAEPRSTIVGEQPGYLRATVTSRLFGFVDDVELLVDTATRLVHLRSSSRVGRGDMGVNRARMERVRGRLQGG